MFFFCSNLSSGFDPFLFLVCFKCLAGDSTVTVTSSALYKPMFVTLGKSTSMSVFILMCCEHTSEVMEIR